MSFITSSPENIKDVYSENMVDELRKISELIEEFNYISMDTEFPGIVYPNTNQISKNVFCNFSNNSIFNGINTISSSHPNSTKSSLPQLKKTNENSTTASNTTSLYDLNYQNIKINVDDLKIIQFGITLSDKYGNHPEGNSTWQFNFKFDLETDIYLHESIQLLEFSGIDFNKFYHEGIEQEYFAENIIASGIVLNESVKWITFHGAYDFAYLLKTISNQPLPNDEQTFLEYLFIYFPNFYDLRYMIKNILWLKGSLSRIASDLDIKWNGSIHQAGCDSVLTSKVFTKLCRNYRDYLTIEKDLNMLYGFNSYCQDDSENNLNSNTEFGSNTNLNPNINFTGPENKTEISSQANPVNSSTNVIFNNYNKFQINPQIRPNNGMVYNPYVNMNFNISNQNPNVLYSNMSSSHTPMPPFNNYNNFDYNNYFGGNIGSFSSNARRK